jgi:hypothetical protein
MFRANMKSVTILISLSELLHHYKNYEYLELKLWIEMEKYIKLI